MFQKIAQALGIDPSKKVMQRFLQQVAEINQLEDAFEALNDEQLRQKTAEFRQRLTAGETLDDLLVEAFAAVREAAKRTIGLRPYDVQLIGGIVLHEGRIAEMRTGEGKTLVATLPVYLNALAGKGVHLITVNDYLARRDARWMAPVYQALGMNVGVLQMASRTDNGRNAFLVDLEKSSPHEDQNQLRLVNRAEAYRVDITYGTNSEFGFDYLRDNLTLTLEERVQRGHFYAIVDEVDNVLIDEARTPLIISGPASDDTEWYLRMAQVVRALRPEDYEINEKDRTVSLTELGEVHVEEILDTPLRDPNRPEELTPEQARLMGYLEKALQAQFLYKRNKDYLVQTGKVVIVDEFTGRLMPGRRWSEGLHQAVEAKEGVKVEPENITYATITLQNYFRMYAKLSGMTGTALTEAEEFGKIYKLEVTPIPTNLEHNASQEGSPLVAREAKDEFGYKYTFYARRNDSDIPVFYKRKDYPDVVYRSEEAKLRAIVREIVRYYVIGRPQLVGTTSVEHSERLSRRLEAEPVRRLLQVQLLRRAWMEKNNTDLIEKPVPEFQPLNAPVTEINPGDLRPIARSFGLTLNLEDTEAMRLLLIDLDLNPEDASRLVTVIQGGVPHQVLNARKHDEESQIIARAGAFGAVTIATNMAGRGVDIKLGGDLDEELINDTNRVLSRTGIDPYNLTLDQRYEALKKVNPEDYGIYEEQVKALLEHVENMKRVRALGGLHVVGSERHESRRIDNQLRGRAARQGDPGSSRFYLSLDDDLMRLFGGQQAENLLKRMPFFDEYLPVELGLLGRLVEQSQERVEGANFDVRKHLLEYDDVLNTQRKRIYEQRDRVFAKDDLAEDVGEMLRTELATRVPDALKDEEGPWKLLAYLDDVQPAMVFEDIAYPPFSYRVLIDWLKEQLPDQPNSADFRAALLRLAENALNADEAHTLNGARQMFERASETLEAALSERADALDTFFDGLDDRLGEEGTPAPRSIDLLGELQELVRTPLKLTNEQLRRLPEGDREVVDVLRSQIDDAVYESHLKRAAGALIRRLEENIEINLKELLQLGSWAEMTTELLEAVEAVFDQRREKLLGEQGQIARDLDPVLDRLPRLDLEDKTLITLMSVIANGTRVGFDARTHQRRQMRYARLHYIFLAAQVLQENAQNESRQKEFITEQVSSHLEGALQALQRIRGLAEWNRLAALGNVTLTQFDEKTRRVITEALGQEVYDQIKDWPLNTLEEEDHNTVQNIIGDRLQNESYRQILLRVISDRWIDYLTQVEALRVSIGLEAYAQRDPLVQYKSKASEMFTQLLGDIRIGVLGMLFNYRINRVQATQLEEGAAVEEAQGAAPAGAAADTADNTADRNRKKRRRH